jgi:hypothetical protein
LHTFSCKFFFHAADRLPLAPDAAVSPKPGELCELGWNWDSHQQVKQAFAGIGVTLESTSDDVLAKLDHPVAGLLREYRAVQKNGIVAFCSSLAFRIFQTLNKHCSVCGERNRALSRKL